MVYGSTASALFCVEEQLNVRSVKQTHAHMRTRIPPQKSGEGDGACAFAFEVAIQTIASLSLAVCKNVDEDNRHSSVFFSFAILTNLMPRYSSEDGGALYMHQVESLTMTNATFSSSSAGGSGGAVYYSSSSIKCIYSGALFFRQVTMVDNSAEKGEGGAVFIQYTGQGSRIYSSYERVALGRARCFLCDYCHYQLSS